MTKREGFGSLDFTFEEDFVECGKITLIDFNYFHYLHVDK